MLALSGVIAAGTAVRTERRRVAGYAATALFVLATWVRLASSDVSAPEAYTLAVTLPALAVGLLRRRRDPEASSWTAYGPGLAATLLPSLLAAWGDPDWPRPLLLGLAALALTLAGARLRLQAPLVLGGAALALDTLHELAPYVAQMVGLLPRWLPPALAGLLLLAVGATYEQRLRDARRLRGTLGRMR
ncbi:SCO7613 C-terminal domain-containing membrane protein [Streptomyces sp. NPDC059872]|uniref:SCO7613 C-terminal domain-containing membrane protein n=1 Tax=Streptomyces sp. NPDC059872 TaxID=3346981 RepID=UPI00365D2BC8